MGENGYHLHARGGRILSVTTKWPDGVEHESVPAGLECSICGDRRQVGAAFHIDQKHGELCGACFQAIRLEVAV